MNIFNIVSDYILPIVVLGILSIGLIKKQKVYDDFVRGAESGFKVVMGIMPTLIGLMVAVGILRASGALDALSRLIAPATDAVHFPSELVPLVIVKAFSSSAATGLLLDVYSSYGPDSYLGNLSSIILSCTETIFYTVTVYFMAVKVTKTRYTLTGALLCTLAGIIASTLLVNLM